ncbi:hypothetical protein CFOL_v3_14511 [Cephalotus follicularis]|uniref:Uncharacterized protein n=1 Tax=Cephalotus follicularis TaxID=3775 RepID=A0A1Q3BST7_CEPFO|nr:hypothetical protein CFOL_v3_14511 [Cephalotus follicularis]
MVLDTANDNYMETPNPPDNKAVVEGDSSPHECGEIRWRFSKEEQRKGHANSCFPTQEVANFLFGCHSEDFYFWVELNLLTKKNGYPHFRMKEDCASYRHMSTDYTVIPLIVSTLTCLPSFISEMYDS